MPRSWLALVGTLVTSSSLASAEPAVATEAPPTTTTSYVAAGGMLGILGRIVGFGAAFDGGHQIADRLWFHGRVVIAHGGDLANDGTGNVFQARAGVETRRCVHAGDACGVLGVDLGYEHRSQTYGVMVTEENHAIGVLRAGLDVGSAAIRVRPAVEISVNERGQPDGVSAELGLACPF